MYSIVGCASQRFFPSYLQGTDASEPCFRVVNGGCPPTSCTPVLFLSIIVILLCRQLQLVYLAIIIMSCILYGWAWLAWHHVASLAHLVPAGGGFRRIACLLCEMPARAGQPTGQPKRHHVGRDDDVVSCGCIHT